MGGVAVEHEGGEEAVLLDIENEALSSVAEHDGLVAVDGQPLGAAFECDGVGQPVSQALHDLLLCRDEQGKCCQE